VTPTFPELKRRTQDNLVAFLQVETKLADTFCDVAQRTENQGHRARLMRKIQEIVNVLHHSEDRIEDRSIRADVRKKADSLSEFLVKNSK
jgi:hypothetical protein